MESVAYPPAGLAVPVRNAGGSAIPITRFLLQTSHRLAAAGLLALVGAGAAIFTERDPTKAVAAVVVLAAAGLSTALMARSQSPRRGTAIVLVMAGLMAGSWLLLLSQPTYSVAAVAIGLATATGVILGTAEVTNRAAWREATGVLAVHAVLLVIAVTLMLYNRRDPIRDGVQSVLAPTPALAPQPQGVDAR